MSKNIRKHHKTSPSININTKIKFNININMYININININIGGSGVCNGGAGFYLDSIYLQCATIKMFFSINMITNIYVYP